MRDIETIRNRGLLLQELKRQNTIFNISDFYLDEENMNVHNRGAVEIVTSDHDLSCFANCSHMLAVKNIFKLLYEDFENFNNDVWQEDSCSRGNVLFQFCPTSFSLAWIPKKISLYQFRRISFVLAMFDEINSEMLKSDFEVPDCFVKHEVNGKERYISMETNIQDSNGNILHLSEAMPEIKNRVLTLKK